MWPHLKWTMFSSDDDDLTELKVMLFDEESTLVVNLSTPNAAIYSNILDYNTTTITTTTQQHSQDGLELWMKIILSVVLAAMTIGCIIGNSLVILAVLQVHKLKTPSNFLIVSLAVSDWLVGIIVMPLSMADTVLGRWPLDENVCSMFVTFDVMLCTASILNLMMISIDRYLVITQPFRYSQKRTAKLMIVYISIAWGTSLLISVTPMMVGWNADYSVGRCMVNQKIGYQIYATLGAFYLPLTVMIILYGRIFFISSKITKAEAKNNPYAFTDHLRMENNNSTSQPSMELMSHKFDITDDVKADLTDSGLQLSDELLTDDQRACTTTLMGQKVSVDRSVSVPEPQLSSTLANGDHKSVSTPNGTERQRSWPAVKKFSVATVATMKRFLHKRKSSKNSSAIKTLGVIMGLFTACWLPFFILAVVTPICGCDVPKWVFNLLTWLGYVNSCFNPIIYARFNREFRTPFREILCCRCHTINQSVRHTDYMYQYGS